MTNILNKLRKKWRIRNFTLFGKRFLRQEKYLPLNVKNINKIAFFIERMEKVKDVPGSIVECGVWRGRSLLILGALAGKRNVWGFDSFRGFPPLSPFDNKKAAEKESFTNTSAEMVSKFLSFNKLDSIQLIEGRFDQTLPKYKEKIGKIALLNLDVDVYGSYKTCLEQLYNQMSPGGIILLDEYKSDRNSIYTKWPGASKAIDEFCEKRNITVSEPEGKAYILIKK